MNMRDQLTQLTRGAAQIITEAELAQKLRANRPLRIKLGVDPTSADIHLGHTVVLRKLRDFQEAGHQAIFHRADVMAVTDGPVVGSVTRPILPLDHVDRDAEAAHGLVYALRGQGVADTVSEGFCPVEVSFRAAVVLYLGVALER